MERRCENCFSWIRNKNGEPGSRVTKSGRCTRFPEWVITGEGHYCGEFSCIVPEKPKQKDVEGYESEEKISSFFINKLTVDI